MESNSIGARVAERRNEMGLKQRELADMLSVKRETVNQWENGITANQRGGYSPVS